jgi:hypothetical protein
VVEYMASRNNWVLGISHVRFSADLLIPTDLSLPLMISSSTYSRLVSIASCRSAGRLPLLLLKSNGQLMSVHQH